MNTEEKNSARRVRFRRVLPFLIVTAIGAGIVFFVSKNDGANAAESVPDVVDYNFHVRPILSDRCFKCHGPDANAREANLRLDTESGAFAALQDDSLRHVVVPNEAMQSELYLRIIATDTSVLMPPPSSNLKLSSTEIQIIKKWINQGAKYKKHWAFITPEKPTLPKPSGADWAKNEIDLFILEKMKKAGLEPNEEADKEVLLKRVAADLTGLPPTIEMQDRFANDKSPDAYDKIVDELMKSPHYGEKMAIPWLDLARYADSHGYQDDGYRTMWPWRDWVIHAFNKNYPYDQFITWQLAGDLLPNPTKEQLLASGFNRNHKITQEGGVIDEEYRLEYVTDRTNTFGKAFLSLTFECAKCHDHKYDPIAQKDYYSTFAFFNQVNEKGLVGDIGLASLADPPNMQITSEDVKTIMPFVNKIDTAPVTVMVMKDSSQRRVTRVLNRGVYDQPGDTVQIGLPSAILPFDSNMYAKNRLGLAEWLTDKRNPLTARVFVNRIWQEIFGRGLVKSVGDFGMQGDLPTHPELLDWLATDFRENGWDVKRLMKQILSSATYRQSSAISKKQLERDPENKWYSHSPRLRLSAELTKDHVLASSGLLVQDIGGPSVKGYQPKGIWEASTSGRGQLARYVQDHGEKLYRRGMYFFIKRTAPPPSMLIFDASTRDQCEVNRIRTNTPLQALVMLNDPQVLEASRVLAQKLQEEKSSDEEKINIAFRRILCRTPQKEELKMLTDYFQSELSMFQKDKARAAKFVKVGEYPMPQNNDVAYHAALMQIVHTLYNLEEASTKS
jgi:Protein of unknown function (DUF1553)/Protein of unknown function (DUF1549)/Planctomycete cytochrome C